MKFRLIPWFLAGALALSLLAAVPARARVFTTKGGTVTDPFENPGSFQARSIYSGKFRVNGQPADMRILSSSLSSADTLKSLLSLTREQPGGLRYKNSGGMVVGALGQGESEKRFLITSLNSPRSCLVLVMDHMDAVPARGSSRIPWPASLPELDPAQQPQLMVEHLDTHSVFAAVKISGASAEDVRQQCSNRFRAAGWKVTPLPEKATGRSHDSDFEILGQKDKLCWLETKRNSTDGSVLVTLLCQIP